MDKIVDEDNSRDGIAQLIPWVVIYRAAFPWHALRVVPDRLGYCSYMTEGRIEQDQRCNRRERGLLSALATAKLWAQTR